jgi:hypothetical protein
MTGSFRSPPRRPGRAGFLAVLTVAGLALTGCAVSPAASTGPTASPTMTASGAPTDTAAAPADTPAPAPDPTAAAPEDTPAPAPASTAAATAITAETPIDALAAWALCKGLGDAGNQSVHALTRVYDPANITSSADGFTVQLLGEIGARGTTDSWCDVSGTFGDPRAAFHLIQDEPTGATASPAFTGAAPAAGERTEGSPMDPLTAWTVCKGFERGLALELEAETGIVTNAYDPGLITAADGTFTVYILGSADSTGPTATCTISGPLGDPAAEFLLPR